MAKITTEKVKIFLEYGGDNDGLARVGRPEQQRLFEADEWYLISDLFQDAELITKKLASEEYEQRFRNNLDEYCEPHEKIEITQLIFKTK